MSKVRVRKDTGKLFIDFQFGGRRCREQTALDDSPKNRKLLQSLLNKLDAQIELGQFVYSEFFPSSPNAKKFDALTNLNQADAESESTPYFSEFADQWFVEMKVQWRASHCRNVESILDSSLKPAFKRNRVADITKADILKFRGQLASKKGRGANGTLSPKTVNNHMLILSMILDEAAERFNFDSPYKNIKPLKLQKQHIEPFSLSEVDLFIKHIRADFKYYYTVRFYTGIRTGEIHGLKWKNVDFEKREILVRETFIKGATEYTKTDGSQREIPMMGPVFDALKAQYELTGKVSEYVFCNQEGLPLDNCNITNRVWYPMLRYLGLNKRRPYQTRHTAATLLLASGENPEWVARILGHSSTEMLFKVYSRYIPNLTRQDGSAFERLLTNRFPAAPIKNDQNELGSDGATTSQQKKEG